METILLRLQNTDSGELQVQARRDEQQWEHRVPADTWAGVEAAAAELTQRFESGLRPLVDPVKLRHLGEQLRDMCLAPFYDKLIGDGAPGQIVIISNRPACLN